MRELVDNAIDSGARNIHVEIKNGGLDLIRVADDGSGIARQDLSVCTLRHSTSKLSTIEDLAHINSLGFRGEALYSVAAVSRLRIRSRPPGQSGYQVGFSGAETARVVAVGCSDGTTVEVRNLFYNTPARLKFLKGPSAEAMRIEALVKRYILGHPALAFRLLVDDREAVRSGGTGDAKQALAAVYAWSTAEQMLELRAEEPQAAVSGFISPPGVSRANRSEMHTFVNGRWVQVRSLLFAIQEAYNSVLMVGRYPVTVLNVQVPPQQLDVNVHPAKSEVRFADERGVSSLVGKTARAALLAVTADSTELEAPIQISQFSWSERPAAPDGRGERALVPSASAHGEHRANGDSTGNSTAQGSRLPPLRLLGQLASTYIIAEGPEGMCLIDQHAAHERILLERLQDSVSAGTVDSQSLLEPVVIPLSPVQATRSGEFIRELTGLGFGAETFGTDALLVRAVPGQLGPQHVGALIAALQEGLEGLEGAEERSRAMLTTVACHSAIRAGQVLDLTEMRALIRDLEQTRVPTACAHGRPTLLEVSRAALEREFRRR